MRFSKCRPGNIEYKYNYPDDFSGLGVRGKQRISYETAEGVNALISRAYSSRLPVSDDKRRLPIPKKMLPTKGTHPRYIQLPGSLSRRGSLLVPGRDQDENGRESKIF